MNIWQLSSTTPSCCEILLGTLARIWSKTKRLLYVTELHFSIYFVFSTFLKKSMIHSIFCAYSRLILGSIVYKVNLVNVFSFRKFSPKLSRNCRGLSIIAIAIDFVWAENFIHDFCDFYCSKHLLLGNFYRYEEFNNFQGNDNGYW